VGELAEVATTRVADLIGYQGKRYAERYLSRVATLARAAGGLSPADLVEYARSLHKLMAYKDEYEVARLLTDEGSRRSVRAEYGPDARISWNLHPPMFRALGMDRKIRLGPWARPGMVALARAKRLRGTRLDPFGPARVRRVERRLPEHYADLVARAAAAPGISAAVLTELVAAPDLVRGYEDVKLRNVARYLDTVERLAGSAGVQAGIDADLEQVRRDHAAPAVASA
jgi:indolepyruvate ferredoxin oxidoreductase